MTPEVLAFMDHSVVSLPTRDGNCELVVFGLFADEL